MQPGQQKPYVHKAFPSVRYKHGQEPVTVHDDEQAEAFEEDGWLDCPKKAKDAHVASSKRPPKPAGKSGKSEDSDKKE